MKFPFIKGQWPWMQVSKLKNYYAQLNELITGQFYGEQSGYEKDLNW